MSDNFPLESLKPIIGSKTPLSPYFELFSKIFYKVVLLTQCKLMAILKKRLYQETMYKYLKKLLVDNFYKRLFFWDKNYFAKNKLTIISNKKNCGQLFKKMLIIFLKLGCKGKTYLECSFLAWQRNQPGQWFCSSAATL